MSPQEKSRVLGNITGAFLQAEIITAAMPTALKGIEKITQVVAESRVGQSVAQSVEKLEKFAQSAARIGTAEEVIAVTAEGIPVRIATAAEETMSFQNAAQKIGGAIEEAAKNTAGASQEISQVKGIIKHFSVTDKMREHMFSQNHKLTGIMELGKTEEVILENFTKIVKEIDSMALFLEGSNEIRTQINGIEATIRIFIKNGNVMMLNGFKGLSERVLGNLIIYKG